MNISIPRKYRKLVYVVGVIAGVVTLGIGILDPSIASEASERAQSITDWLTSLVGVIGAAGGVIALLHLTPSTPADPDQPAAGTPPSDDLPTDGTGVIIDPAVTNPSPDFTTDDGSVG